MMNLHEVVIAIATILSGALFGGVFAALIGTFVLTVFRTKQDSKPLRIVMAGGAMLGAVAAQAVRPNVRELFFPPSRVDRLVAGGAGDLDDQPEFKARASGMTHAEATALARKLVHDGLKRLDVTQLAKWNALQLKLARQSPELCAALWAGDLQPTTLTHALDALSDDEVRAWFDNCTQAAKRELESTGPAPDYSSDLAAGLSAVRASLPPAERVRFDHAFSVGTSLPAPEACRMMKQILEAAGSLPEPSRDKLLRGLTSL